MQYPSTLATAALSLVLWLAAPGAARSIDAAEARPVDLVIALDVSGSMNGLIDSARQRLWDIVNTMNRAQPQPDLRIAIISFGDPAYGEGNGYVRLDQPLTRDLDAVNETLFAFRTNGGAEYVARAVHRALDDLQWATEPDALRIVFVAGNESARQDPQFSLETVIAQARQQDVVVNAIFCGDDAQPVAAEWRQLSRISGGLYASIDQNAAAVAGIETPMDGELLALNQALNETYVAYGREGQEKLERQQRQDRNAAAMSAPAAASRTVAKASALYDASDWDLVDAAAAGQDVGAMEAEELPEALREMDADERRAEVKQKLAQRQAIQQRIAELDRERRDYIAAERVEREAENGLDQAVLGGIRQLAESRGFTFEESSKD